jgi:DNA segregation ATPase FtsK/SpoIIIE-like protein
MTIQSTLRKFGEIMKMHRASLHDPLFDNVRQLVIETRNPSVSHAQRNFKLGFRRTEAMIAALEGELVSRKFPDGWRRMLSGPTAGLESSSFP